MDPISVRAKFDAALAALVEQIERDRSILAVILCGSLSHDTVWARSDIDLVLVTIDDRKVPASDIALYADGTNVHASLMPRAEFRKQAEGALRQSFMHSLLAKGRLLFTRDPTIADVFDRLQQIGERDTAIQLLHAAASALPLVDKAHKWFVTRRDLDYTALWLLYAATPLAQIEVISARQLVDREAIPQAMKLNPAFFRIVYTDLLNTPKTVECVQAALDAVDRYIAERAPSLFGAILDHLRDAGEARASSEIESYFARNFRIHGATTACEYLADKGLVGKASAPAHLTKKSNLSVEELAFFAIEHVPAR